jgi:hypothetical protein
MERCNRERTLQSEHPVTKFICLTCRAKVVQLGMFLLICE